MTQTASTILRAYSAPTSIDHVDCASQTGIKRVNRAQDFQRTFRIGHRRFEQRGLVRSTLAFGVARAGIPSSRNDRLIIFYGLVLDLHPVARVIPAALQIIRSLWRIWARCSDPIFRRCEFADLHCPCFCAVLRSSPRCDWPATDSPEPERRCGLRVENNARWWSVELRQHTVRPMISPRHVQKHKPPGVAPSGPTSIT